MGVIRRAALGTVAAGVLSQVILAVSGVLVARILGVEDRGHLALLVLVPSILVQLGSFGLPVAATYELAREPGAGRWLVRRLRGPFLLQAGGLTLVHAAVLAAVLHGAEATVVTAGLMTLALVPATLANTYGLALLQGQHRYRPFNALRIAPNGAYAVALVAMFAVGDARLPLVMAVWVVAMVATGTASLALAVGWTRRQAEGHSGPSTRHLVRLGARGFLGSASPLDSFRVDQAVVGFLLSPSALGLYVVATAFTNLPRFVAQSAGMVAYPHIARMGDAATARRYLWRYFTVTVLACAAMCAALAAAVGWLVPFFFGRAFADAVPIARVLMVSVLFLCARRILSDCSRGAGYPRHGSVAEAAAWLALLPAIAVLLPLEEELGVALAVGFSSAVSFVVMLVAVLRSRPTTTREPAAADLVTG